MSDPLVRVQMCLDCATSIWPALETPSMHEGVLLESVARKLQKCSRPECRLGASRVRLAIQVRRTRTAWAWVETT